VIFLHRSARLLVQSYVKPRGRRNMWKSIGKTVDLSLIKHGTNSVLGLDTEGIPY